MKVLNQMGPRVAAQIAQAMPAVEIESIPLDGPVDPTLRGDVLVSFRRASNLLEAASRVPWVHICGAGVEGIQPELFDDGRTVTCSRGAHAIPIAEYAMAAIIGFEKRLPAIWVDEAPAGEWLPLDVLEARIDAGELSPGPHPVTDPPERWGWTWMGELAGRTLGIVGLGGIGAALAQRALAFDMDVVATRRSAEPSPIPGVRMASSLPELLGQVDHVVVCAPLTDQTRNLFDAAAFAAIKPGAHLVNVARGPLIDEDAMVAALDDGRLALASLDVGIGEPLPAGHRFYRHPQIRMSPHISWTGPRRQERVIDVFIAHLQRAANGQELQGVVDLVRGY